MVVGAGRTRGRGDPENNDRRERSVQELRTENMERAEMIGEVWLSAQHLEKSFRVSRGALLQPGRANIRH